MLVNKQTPSLAKVLAEDWQQGRLHARLPAIIDAGEPQLLSTIANVIAQPRAEPASQEAQPRGNAAQLDAQLAVALLQFDPQRTELLLALAVIWGRQRSLEVLRGHVETAIVDPTTKRWPQDKLQFTLKKIDSNLPTQEEASNNER